jgi:hypothetical protein
MRMIELDPMNSLIIQRHKTYQELVARVQDAVTRLVPVGSIVLVVSKGDSALVEFAQRVGWHFPQDHYGEYAGFHPADSYDAIERLSILHKRGASHIVIPNTSRWWLDYYPQFGEHLLSAAEVVFDEPATGIIFRLFSTSNAQGVNGDDRRFGAHQPSEQLRALVESVLPPGSTIAVATCGDDVLLGYQGLGAIHFPGDENGLYAADSVPAIGNLRALARAGAEFLVVPAVSFQWLEDRPLLGSHIRSTYPVVTVQKSVCAIFDLRRHAADPVR